MSQSTSRVLKRSGMGSGRLQQAQGHVVGFSVVRVFSDPCVPAWASCSHSTYLGLGFLISERSLIVLPGKLL